MAKNYTVAEAVAVLRDGSDTAAIMDIGRRYPLFSYLATTMVAKAGEEFEAFVKYLPEYTTANKINSAIKKTIVEIEAVEVEEEEAPAKKRGPKKAAKKKVVEEEPEEDEEDEELEEEDEVEEEVEEKPAKKAAKKPAKKPAKKAPKKAKKAEVEDDEEDDDDDWEI